MVAKGTRPLTGPKQSRARKGAVEGSQCVGAALAIRSPPDWTATLRARLCFGTLAPSDRLKGGGFSLGDSS